MDGPGTGLVLYVVGFASPHWESFESSGLTYRSGLWERCLVGAEDEQCESLGSDVEDWFKAVQGLQCAGLAIWVLSIVYGLIARRQFSNPRHALVMGLGPLLACILGFVGGLVYAGKTSGNVNYSWAFAINLVGLLCGFVASLAVTFNKSGKSQAGKISGDAVVTGQINIGATQSE
nr:hypothetical protein BaRGS_016533 [Batillaria attramentaria]